VKKKILLIFAILFSGMDWAQAQENRLGVTFNLTYVSKYMSKGAESYGQQGGLFKTIDLDFFGTGFGVNVRHTELCQFGKA